MSTKLSTLLLLSLVPMIKTSVHPVQDEAVVLHAVATATHEMMVDLCEYPELCDCIKEFVEHHDLAQVSTTLAELHGMLIAGKTHVSVGMLHAVIEELSLFESNTRSLLSSQQIIILSRRLAAVGLGLNFPSSKVPFTTNIAPQNATDGGATQTVNIGVAQASAQGGLQMNIGTGYTTQNPRQITIGSAGTTTTINGNVVFTGTPATNALVSTTAATITTRSGTADQRVFTFDSLGGDQTLT